MSKIFSDADALLDKVFSYICSIKNKYSMCKTCEYITKEEINDIKRYIEKSTVQIIKLDSVSSSNDAILYKRKQYIIATQTYIGQLECLKDGKEYTILLSNESSDRDEYLPENRHSEYALYDSFTNSIVNPEVRVDDF